MEMSEWTVRYEQSVIEQDIKKLDRSSAIRIRKQIEYKLCIDPIHFGKPLRYSLAGLRSLRIGPWRVIFKIVPDDKMVLILKIGHRREVYFQD